MPTCTSATVKTLGMQQAEVDQTINYTYDPLNRLTHAAYDDGSYYTYTYDAVGNRLSEKTAKTTNTYTYNNANELTSVNGTAYSWDGSGREAPQERSVKGNLLSNSTRTCTYNAAKRLTSITGCDLCTSSRQ